MHDVALAQPAPLCRPAGQSAQAVPGSLEYFPFSQTSQWVFPSVLDQPFGQETQMWFPFSKVPAVQGFVVVHTSSELQLAAVQPLAMAIEEEPPAAMKPATGLLQLSSPSFS